jgi:hypothetical protein
MPPAPFYDSGVSAQSNVRDEVVQMHTIFNMSTTCAVTGTAEAHGKGLILPSEMKIENPKMLRYAPSYAVGAQTTDSVVSHPYTVDALAKFLGFVKRGNQEPTNSFHAAFGAEELIADGVLKESQIKGLSGERGSASFRLPVLVRYRAPLRALSEVIMSEG